MAFSIGAPVRLVVRAATHVNPKATKHHTKSRPKKVRAEYPATSSLSHWDSIQRAALNPETDARRESARGIRGLGPGSAPSTRESFAAVAPRRTASRPGSQNRALGPNKPAE